MGCGHSSCTRNVLVEIGIGALKMAPFLLASLPKITTKWCRGIIIPEFLRWCRMSSIHRMSMFLSWELLLLEFQGKPKSSCPLALAKREPFLGLSLFSGEPTHRGRRVLHWDTHTKRPPPRRNSCAPRAMRPPSSSTILKLSMSVGQPSARASAEDCSNPPRKRKVTWYPGSS